jgi:hypothetical protein
LATLGPFPTMSLSRLFFIFGSLEHRSHSVQQSFQISTRRKLGWPGVDVSAAGIRLRTRAVEDAKCPPSIFVRIRFAVLHRIQRVDLPHNLFRHSNRVRDRGFDSGTRLVKLRQFASGEDRRGDQQHSFSTLIHEESIARSIRFVFATNVGTRRGVSSEFK